MVPCVGWYVVCDVWGHECVTCVWCHVWCRAQGSVQCVMCGVMRERERERERESVCVWCHECIMCVWYRPWGGGSVQCAVCSVIGKVVCGVQCVVS